MEAQEPASPAKVGRRAGGPLDRRGLRTGSGRTRPLDLATAGRQVGRTGDRRFHRQGRRAQRTEKNELKPWLKEQWVLPKPHDADYVAAMEDVLEVYQRPYDEQRPVVCVDEATKQLVADVTPPLPMEPGQPGRQGDEYERRGTANLFLGVDPLAGARPAGAREPATARDVC